MNDPQRSTLDASRPTETAPDDVFALTPCSVDGASISAGTLCLVMPGGEAVRIPVDRERVGAVARALMLRPAVLLAREGVALPPGLAQEQGRSRVEQMDRDATNYAGGVSDAVLAVQRVAAGLVRTSDGLALEAAVDAIRAIQPPGKTYADGLREAGEAVGEVRHGRSQREFDLTERHRNAIFALLGLAPEGYVGSDTALPGVVVFADRLRDIARPLPPGALRCDLLRLAGDLSRATDPCRGYPSAEEVLAVCDAVIEDMHCGGESLFAEGCERLRSRLAEAMDARPSKAPAPAADPLAELREAQRDSRAAHDAMDILRVALATLAETGSVEADPALVQAVGETTVRDLLDLHARISADRPKAYAYGLQDAGVAVAGVALGYAAHSGARAVADQCQDAIAALRSQARKTSVMPVQVTADAIDGWADTLLDLAYRPDARERAVALAETLRVAAANHEVRP